MANMHEEPPATPRAELGDEWKEFLDDFADSEQATPQQCRAALRYLITGRTPDPAAAWPALIQLLKRIGRQLQTDANPTT